MTISWLFSRTFILVLGVALFACQKAQSRRKNVAFCLSACGDANLGTKDMPKAVQKEDLRHNQLFELIRQKHQADKTVLQKKDKLAPKATASDIEHFKLAAARSLQASA